MEGEEKFSQDMMVLRSSSSREFGELTSISTLFSVGLFIFWYVCHISGHSLQTPFSWPCCQSVLVISFTPPFSLVPIVFNLLGGFSPAQSHQPPKPYTCLPSPPLLSPPSFPTIMQCEAFLSCSSPPAARLHSFIPSFVHTFSIFRASTSTQSHMNPL